MMDSHYPPYGHESFPIKLILRKTIAIARLHIQFPTKICKHQWLSLMEQQLNITSKVIHTGVLYLKDSHQSYVKVIDASLDHNNVMHYRIKLPNGSELTTT